MKRIVEWRGRETLKIEEFQGDTAIDLKARIVKHIHVQGDRQQLFFRIQEISDGDALSLFEGPCVLPEAEIPVEFVALVVSSCCVFTVVCRCVFYFFCCRY